MDHGAMTVEFKGPSNCHIGLMSVRAEDRPLTEIILGGWDNTASVIRVNRESPDRVRQETPRLLNAQSFTKFYIRWANGSLWVRRDNEKGPIVIEGKDCCNFLVKYVAFRSGWGARGQWRVNIGDQSLKPISGGAPIGVQSPSSRINAPSLKGIPISPPPEYCRSYPGGMAC